MDSTEGDGAAAMEVEALKAIYTDDFSSILKKESVWAVAPTPEFRLSLGPRVLPPRVSLVLCFR